MGLWAQLDAFRAEYLYVDLGRQTFTSVPGGRVANLATTLTEHFQNHYNILRVGLNYKFGNYYTCPQRGFVCHCLAHHGSGREVSSGLHAMLSASTSCIENRHLLVQAYRRRLSASCSAPAFCCSTKSIRASASSAWRRFSLK
jgi:hypothetical protein